MHQDLPGEGYRRAQRPARASQNAKSAITPSARPGSPPTSPMAARSNTRRRWRRTKARARPSCTTVPRSGLRRPRSRGLGCNYLAAIPRIWDRGQGTSRGATERSIAPLDNSTWPSKECLECVNSTGIPWPRTIPGARGRTACSRPPAFDSRRGRPRRRPPAWRRGPCRRGCGSGWGRCSGPARTP